VDMVVCINGRYGGIVTPSGHDHVLVYGRYGGRSQVIHNGYCHIFMHTTQSTICTIHLRPNFGCWTFHEPVNMHEWWLWYVACVLCVFNVHCMSWWFMYVLSPLFCLNPLPANLVVPKMFCYLVNAVERGKE
jgi:hypothetical protein